jgi:hypothetical protein
MDITKAKRMLAHGSIEELQQIRSYATQRIAELTKREREAIKEQTEASYAQAWDAIGKKAKKGMFVLVSSRIEVDILKYRVGERYSKPARRLFESGEIFRVVGIRPRLKTLWVAENDEMQLGFKPEALFKIGISNLHLFPDELRANIAKVKLCGKSAQ